MKCFILIVTVCLTLALAPVQAAVVAVLTGNYTPDSTVVEAPNTVSYADLFTTVVFPDTSWTANDGFVKMTTAPSRGIWFGSHPTAGSDPGGFLP